VYLPVGMAADYQDRPLWLLSECTAQNCRSCEFKHDLLIAMADAQSRQVASMHS
jgi:hypothetical protein